MAAEEALPDVGLSQTVIVGRNPMLLAASRFERQRSIFVYGRDYPVLFNNVTVVVAFALRRNIRSTLTRRRTHLLFGENNFVANLETICTQWLSFLACRNVAESLFTVGAIPAIHQNTPASERIFSQRNRILTIGHSTRTACQRSAPGV